jgi:hypothetical protein
MKRLYAMLLVAGFGCSALLAEKVSLDNQTGRNIGVMGDNDKKFIIFASGQNSKIDIKNGFVVQAPDANYKVSLPKKIGLGKTPNLSYVESIKLSTLASVNGTQLVAEASGNQSGDDFDLDVEKI